MAESWRAKANRYARGDFTPKELKIAIGGLLFDQVIDIATFGRLSQLKGKALQRVVIPLLRKTAVPAAASIARSALGASRLLMFNPYIAGATAIYVGYHERERIAELLKQGYEISAPQFEEGGFIRERLQPGAREPEGPGFTVVTDYSEGRTFGVLPTQIRKKRPSKFNQAVKAGMLAVKKSTSYGKKGTIKPAKKAFSVVVKLASAKSKKRKAPKSGLKRKIWNAMRGY